MQNMTHGKINRVHIFPQYRRLRKKKKKSVEVISGPELCIALRQRWEKQRRMAEEGEEGAGQHCTLIMGSSPYKGYRHSEVFLCLSKCSVFLKAEVYSPQSLFCDRHPESGTLVTQSSPMPASRSCNQLRTQDLRSDFNMICLS